MGRLLGWAFSLFLYRLFKPLPQPIERLFCVPIGQPVRTSAWRDDNHHLVHADLDDVVLAA